MTVLEGADMNRRYHTFFFDLDGTITDSEQGITNSVKYALNNCIMKDIENQAEFSIQAVFPTRRRP